MKIIAIIFFFFHLNQAMKAQIDYEYDRYETHVSKLKFFESEDGKMAFLDVGNGEKVILLIHGVPTSSWLYRKMVNPLAEAGFRVVAPDMLGYGSSDKPGNTDLFAPKFHGKRILALMKHLNISSWAQVVHDAGGPWSWEMILADDSKLNSLIILNTILFEEGFDPPMHLKKGTWKSGLIIGFYGSKFGAKTIINTTLGSGTKTCNLSRKEKKGYSKPLVAGANRAIGYFFTGFDEMLQILPKIHARLKTKKIPTLVIWGKHDKILEGEKQVPLIIEKLGVPEKNVHFLDDSDHFVQEDNPSEVVRLIVEYLN